MAEFLLAAASLALATVALGLLVAAVVMFALNRPRMDAVALLMLAILPLTGVITMNEELAMAQDLGASPYPFAMTVALAASAAFMTPVSSPVNTLVVGPGNYAFGDFVKVGVPFTIVVLIVSMLLVPLLLPLG